MKYYIYGSIYAAYINKAYKYINFQKPISSIYRSKFWSVYIYQSIYFNIDRYMFSYSDHILFYISGVIRPLHISVNISPLRLNHFNITYIDQYMPTSGIYRSIYVIFQWFKLGAYIGPIYVRSYNDRYIKTYILPISWSSEFPQVYLGITWSLHRAVLCSEPIKHLTIVSIIRLVRLLLRLVHSIVRRPYIWKSMHLLLFPRYHVARWYGIS